MADDELRLNTVERFSKQSTRLVLEEHGHCEVPAGCGGVVLQWHDPEAGLPVTVQLIGSMGEGQVFIDGEPMQHSRVVLAYGMHQLAIKLGDVKGPHWFIVAVGPRDADIMPELSSAADGTWRATTRGPGDDWLAAAFDDGGWTPLSAAPPIADDMLGYSAYQYRNALSRGGVALELPDAETVWVRSKIDVRRKVDAP